MIAFVVKACEVENAMQSKDLDLFRHRMSQPICVLPGDVDANRQFTGKLFERTARHGRSRERQYIGRPIFSSELPV
jgi:hypothetical protein